MRPGRDTSTFYYYRRADGALFKSPPADLDDSSPGVFSSESFVASAPLKAYVDPTNRCNLACRHCITSSSPAVDTSGELPTGRLLDFVAELAQIGVLEVAVAGGEPFLHPDWAVIMRRVTDHGMNLIVTTNGLRLDQPAVTELCAIGPLDVRVSFEGGPRFHEHVRGRRTYEPAMDALARLIRSGVPASARLTLCQGTQDELPTFFDDISAAGVQRVKVALAKRAGRAATPSGRHLVVDNVDPVVVALLERLAQEHDLFLQLAADDFAVELADGQLSKLRDIERPNCGAGFETCHITPRGELLACAAIPNMPMGSLQNRSFIDLWEGHLANRYRQQATHTTSRRLCDTLSELTISLQIPRRRAHTSSSPASPPVVRESPLGDRCDD